MPVPHEHTEDSSDGNKGKAGSKPQVNKDAWEAITKKLDTLDDDLAQGYKDDIDTLLVFSSLDRRVSFLQLLRNHPNHCSHPVFSRLCIVHITKGFSMTSFVKRIPDPMLSSPQKSRIFLIGRYSTSISYSGSRVLKDVQTFTN